MSLKKQIVPMPLINPPGADAGTDPKLVQGITVANNVHWARQGAAEKRFFGMWEDYAQHEGYGYLLAPTSGTAPVLIGEKLWMRDDNTYYWTEIDDVGISDIETKELLSLNDGYMRNATYIEFNDYYVLSYNRYVYNTSSYDFQGAVEVYSLSTNSLISSAYISLDDETGQYHMMRAVKTGTGDVFFYYIENDSKEIMYFKADASSGVLSEGEAIPALLLEPADSSNLDACLSDDGNTVFLAYICNVLGETKPVVIAHNTYFDSFQQTCVDPLSITAWRIGIFPFTDTDDYGAAVSWFEAGEQKLYALTVAADSSILRSSDGAETPLLVLTYGGTTAITSITGIQTADGFFRIYYSYRSYIPSINDLVADGQAEESISAELIYTSSTNIIDVYSFPLPFFTAEKSTIISKPWIDTSNEILLLTATGGKTFALRNSSGDIIGRTVFEASFPDAYNEGTLSDGFTVPPYETGWNGARDTDGYLFSMGIMRKEGENYTILKAGIETGIINIGNREEILQQGNTDDILFIPNSNPYQFDGKKVVEEGFLDTPRYITLSYNTGGTLTPGKYWFQALYSWSDASGALHRSVPSRAFSITLTAGQTSVNVTVPTIRCSRKEGINIEVYRTSVNGIEPKLCMVLSNDEWLAGDAITFEDIKSDADIVAEKTIYIYGGVIESVSPPSYWVHTLHQSRHFVVDRNNENTHIYYSKVLVPGNAIEYSDSFLIKVPSDGGPIHALVSMLDRLIIMKQDAIYVVSGSGPTPTGTQESWSEPYAVSKSIGCYNRRSIVEVPDGIMFRSRQGIMILTKSLQTEFIGEPVRYWTDNCVITGAVSRKDESCAMWFSQMGGWVLVYNYKLGKWSTWTGDQLKADSVTIVSNDRVWIRDGVLTRFSADNYYYDLYYDPERGSTNVDVVTTLETGWLNFAGIGGFARIYRILLIGQAITSSDSIYCQIAYDYDGYYEAPLEFDRPGNQLQAFDFSEYYGDMDNEYYKENGCILEIVPPRQKCTAIKLKIYDGNESLTKNWSCTALAFVIGVKESGQKNIYKKSFS